MTSTIIAAPPISGETAPMLQIAAGLAGRGHRVTFVGGSRFAAQAEAAGATFVPLAGAADYDDRRIDEAFPDRARTQPGPEQLNFDFAHLSGDGIPAQHDLLQHLLRADPDQVVITNSTFLGMWPVALGASGIRPRRWIAVGANPLGMSSGDTTPFGPAPVEPGMSAKTANLAANAALQEALRPSREHIERIVRSLGATGDVPGFMDGVATVPEVFCALTVPGFEFPRSDAPDSLRFVGPLPAPSPADWSEPAWWPELDTDRPVVVVTQGTLANRDLGELVGPALTGLGQAGVLVVAALGRDVAALPVQVPANARVESFIPFGALLPKADLFITNGGFGATQQALAAGVPVVIAGATEDKPLVAARVAQHGLGVDLRTSTPTPAQIADAVAAVLGDAEIKSNVERIAEVYAEYDAMTAIEQIAAQERS
jgi:MGT family glycosyltransferase